ncbi:hypothetical protein [Paenibacillus alvei]|uniref:hypothetical protein n=1 Tax=Paenibacillus alvei TaxID=44250 RepID=UPI0018CE9DA5|nr:hypothetical protein [Paenibacillus alvei]MBG9735785.1 hypothetical protein [Paenibacillus alvei]MBG9744356.1 hypothetical protein [Paenibacillus alvei]MCY9577908.1 hypothetical protein [Paenibacillus alvei]MCY9587325.1 hypothetical protein [Paenibacillus alvei]
MGKNRKKYIILGIIILAILLLFPLFINYLIMSWSAWGVNGKTEAWLGFISSYYGSLFSGIIGGIFTFAAVYIGFYKNDKDKFLDTYDKKEFLLKENLDLLGREFIGGLKLFPNDLNKLNYYYEKIDLLNEIYENIKETVGADVAKELKVFVMSYSALKYKMNSSRRIDESKYNILDLCEHQEGCVIGIYSRLDKRRTVLKEKYETYKNNAKWFI